MYDCLSDMAKYDTNQKKAASDQLISLLAGFGRDNYFHRYCCKSGSAIYVIIVLRLVVLLLCQTMITLSHSLSLI